MSSVSGQGSASPLTTQSYTLAVVSESLTDANLGVSRVRVSLEGAMFQTEGGSRAIRILPKGSRSTVSICNVPSDEFLIGSDALVERTFEVRNPKGESLCLKLTFYPQAGSCEEQKSVDIGHNSGDRQNFKTVTFAGSNLRFSLCRNSSSTQTTRPPFIDPAHPGVTYGSPANVDSGPVTEMTRAGYNEHVRQAQIDAYVGDNNTRSHVDLRNVVIIDDEDTTLGPDTPNAPTPTPAQVSPPKKLRSGLKEAWV